jgi:hypothetical protein
MSVTKAFMSDRPQSAQYLPSGFSEAGICVQDISPWVELFTGLGGWEISWQGSAPLAPDGEARFIALRTPDGAWLEFYQAGNQCGNLVT